MERTRQGLEKAFTTGVNAAESILLKGEIASLAAKVARVNARIGRDVVSLSPYARLARANGAAKAIAV